MFLQIVLGFIFGFWIPLFLGINYFFRFEKIDPGKIPDQPFFNETKYRLNRHMASTSKEIEELLKEFSDQGLIKKVHESWATARAEKDFSKLEQIRDRLLDLVNKRKGA